MSNRIYYKFFDGKKDNMAGHVFGNPDNFLEADVSKIKPACKKIVLCGFDIEDTRLKLRIGGELTEPKLAETKTEEYAKTFVLAETVTPDAIRFEFGGKKVEIYEIEAY
jgi:hypothetical protein